MVQPLAPADKKDNQLVLCAPHVQSAWLPGPKRPTARLPVPPLSLSPLNTPNAGARRRVQDRVRPPAAAVAMSRHDADDDDNVIETLASPASSDRHADDSGGISTPVRTPTGSDSSGQEKRRLSAERSRRHTGEGSDRGPSFEEDKSGGGEEEEDNNDDHDEEDALVLETDPAEMASWAGQPSIKGSSETMQMVLLAFNSIGITCVCPNPPDNFQMFGRRANHLQALPGESK